MSFIVHLEEIEDNRKDIESKYSLLPVSDWLDGIEFDISKCTKTGQANCRLIRKTPFCKMLTS